MPFGQQAYENSYQTFHVVNETLQADVWNNQQIEDFVYFWSGCLWLTIDGMEDRVEWVYNNVLSVPNPEVDTIKKSLKKKISRWRNDEVNRISPIIQRYLVRNNDNIDQLTHHNNFQNDLGEIGPVLTMWCHYRAEPIEFPPIDRYNYAAWLFISQQQQNIPSKVPNNFSILPIGDPNTDYQHFREWFLNTLNLWKNGHQTVRDVVNLDKAFMSLGAFIRSNNSRTD